MTTHTRKRMIAFTGAVIAMTTAFVLLWRTGLPDRATFTALAALNGQLSAPAIGGRAPVIHADSLSPQAIDWHGGNQTVIINFWATWCAPCRVEMPELQDLAETRPDIRIIAVNMGETRQQAQRWVDEFGLTFDIALDPTGDIVASYQLRGQPSTYVVDSRGIITHIFYGPTTANALMRAINTHQG